MDKKNLFTIICLVPVLRVQIDEAGSLGVDWLNFYSQTATAVLCLCVALKSFYPCFSDRTLARCSTS